MKKIFTAVLLTAALIAMLTVSGYAEETAPAATEEVTETATEEVTETATETVDGAILEEDYLTRMVTGAKDWLMTNPETVGSAACSGIMLVAAVVMSGTTKKTRKEGEKREKSYAERSTVMNNNAVEMVETAKNIVTEGKAGIMGAVADVLTGFREVADTIATELRLNRMETRANGILLAELVVDAKIPAKRKKEIMDKYRHERGEEVEADDAADEA